MCYSQRHFIMSNIEQVTLYICREIFTVEAVKLANGTAFIVYPGHTLSQILHVRCTTSADCLIPCCFTQGNQNFTFSTATLKESNVPFSVAITCHMND